MITVPPNSQADRQALRNPVFPLQPDSGQQRPLRPTLLAHLAGLKAGQTEVHPLRQQETAVPQTVVKAALQTVFLQGGAQRKVVLLATEQLVLLLLAPVAVGRQGYFKVCPPSLPAVLQQPDQVVPPHHLVRSVRGVETVIVQAPQEGGVQVLARVNLEMHLPINVPHLGGEILHPAQKGRQDAADRLVLPAQGRDPGR